mgnify:CR=1 FL=1
MLYAVKLPYLACQVVGFSLQCGSMESNIIRQDITIDRILIHKGYKMGSNLIVFSDQKLELGDGVEVGCITVPVGQEGIVKVDVDGAVYFVGLISEDSLFEAEAKNRKKRVKDDNGNVVETKEVQQQGTSVTLDERTSDGEVLNARFALTRPTEKAKKVKVESDLIKLLRAKQAAGGLGKLIAAA